MRLPASDDELRAHLAHANLPALLPAIAQLTGDLSLLSRFAPPATPMLGAVDGKFSQADQAAIRALAFDALRGWRDGAAALPPIPSTETLQALMNWCAGEALPTHYVPLAIEEAALAERDPRRFEWARKPKPEVLAGFHVAVIGAGFGGVLAGIRLGQAGIPHTIFEKNDSVGGTWFENTYPDLRVDVPNHFYSYSFRPNPDWPDYFSRGPEIEAYLETCARETGVRERVRFGTEVTRVEWDEATARWRVSLRGCDGREEVFAANAVISAVGMLNRPKLPEIEGIESFAGPRFHSARWRHDVALANRRVGVIGTGASAVQFVPRIAEQVAQLAIFQRAAHWISFNASYRATIHDSFKWCLRHVPFHHNWYRFLLFWTGSDRAYPVFRIDPKWKDPERSTSRANDFFRQAATEYMREQLGGDPALLAKCLPEYPPLGKRPLLDNGWYATLRRPNVELVTSGIRRITADGIETQDRRAIPLDVLVLATGFHAGHFLWPMQITGRGGVRLEDRWEGGENPRAHLGITVPDFPNLFCLYGPNTNPVVGSVIYMLECQVGYVMGCLRAMLEHGWHSLDCRPEVHDAYNARLDAEMEHMVWRHPRVHSYYNNRSGRVITNVPWTMYDYWKLTRTPDFADFRIA
jgi:4-hydroxyacetophenone monooxygenase